jgi:DNA-binding response OmpR family regulator
VLGEQGYLISVASDGEEALRMVEQEGLKPDLVLTDVVMPLMSGPALIGCLRRMYADLKVVYMSGYSDNANVQRDSLQLGNAYIQKPFKAREIKETIRQVMSDTRKGQYVVRVVMVDDDPQYVDLLMRYCKRNGFECVGCESLGEVLEILRKGDASVLLVDYGLAGTSGKEVLKGIRAEGIGTPAILLSGDLYSVDVESLIPLGVVKAIEKSGDVKELIEVIRTVSLTPKP